MTKVLGLLQSGKFIKDFDQDCYNDEIVRVRKTWLFNHMLGFIFGAMKGIVPIALILWAFELFPIQNWTDTLYQKSRIANIVKTIRDKNVEYFGWEDPVNAGKKYIKSIIVDNNSVQESDD